MLVSSAAQAQADCGWTSEGTWANYQAGTLSETQQKFAPLKPEGEGVTATGAPVKVQVRYEGKMRSISEVNREAIAKFAGSEQTVTELFTKEFLFTENGVKYWLPLQAQMMPFVEKELSKGDQVELLTLWVGYSHPKGKEHHTFVVNEFCKP